MRHIKGIFTLLLLGLFTQVVVAQSTIQVAEDLTVQKLAEGVYMHTSGRNIEGWGPFPSNGLLVVSGEVGLLIDSAWGDAPTQKLLDWVTTTLGVTVERAVFTHAHDDRMGGIATLQRAGIVTYTLPQSVEGALAQDWPRPDSLLAPEQTLTVGTQTVETFFPGAGHTPDNLVVWIPQWRMLFGGCMVRPSQAKGMGNVADAVLQGWGTAIKRVQARYPEVKIVVPSHGEVGDRALLQHTLDLLKAYKKKHPGG